MNFYTINHNGKKYTAYSRWYQWKKVAEDLGAPRSAITRGALVGQPIWNTVRKATEEEWDFHEKPA